MNPGQLGALVRLARAMPARVRQPVTPEAARARLREQLARRGDLFLEMTGQLVYAHPASPYRRLLLHAGIDPAELARRVRAQGLDAALAGLRDAGVYLTLAEFKRQVPVRRPGLTFAPAEADFDNPGFATGEGAGAARRDGAPGHPAGGDARGPRGAGAAASHGGAAISGTTSGTSSAATRVLYSWEFIAEEAAHEALLYEAHGVLDRPVALWYPVLPGVAGVHNLLLNLLIGRPPERWFSQTDPAGAGTSWFERAALAGLRFGARLGGARAPAPEFADLAHADRVLDWLLDTVRRGQPGVLRTFASSAVRVAERAAQRGARLTGVTFFTGGEPLTEARRAWLEATGARAFPRYIATEPGLLAAACPERATTDDMHVYEDRVAVIEGRGAGAEEAAGAGAGAAPDRRAAGPPGRGSHVANTTDPAADLAGPPAGLLFTTLAPHVGKILLNTELGDQGTLSRRACGCVFGRLGFTQRVAQVGSRERLTLEGMTVPAAALDERIGALVAAAGGSPDSWQCRVTADARGLGRLEICLDPALTALADEEAFLAALYARLAAGEAGLALAADVWRHAGTLRVVREAPRLTGGQKHRPVLAGPTTTAPLAPSAASSEDAAP